MMIKYNGSNVHAMGLMNKADKKMGNSPQLIKGLQPGWNEFPADIWNQNKENPTIKRMVEKKMIELMSEPVVLRIKDKKTGKVKAQKRLVGADDRPVRIKWFDEKKAIDIVKDTFNRDVLQRWLDEENRHRVKKALDKQIKPLLNLEKDEEDGQDDVFDEEEYE